MKTVKLEDDNIKELLQRSQIDADSVIGIVTNIVNDVKNDGDEKIRQYTEKFDGVYLKDFLISQEELKESVKRIDKDLIHSLKKASSNIRKFHQAQLPHDWSMEVDNGITAGQIVRPLERVGCYIPGGRAVYPSSILMTVIPANVAGVDEIICCTPPGPDGKVEDIVLAAAYLAGVHNVYRVGGAQALQQWHTVQKPCLLWTK